jgi:hypothetical protein
MKQLKKDLKNGKSKNEVLKDFQERGNENITKAVMYLNSIPDELIAKKYALANNILLGLYSIVSILILAVTFAQTKSSFILIDVAVFITMAFFIAKKKAWAYLVLAFLMVRSILNVLKPYLAEPTTGGLVMMSIFAFIFIFALVLKVKLFPKQNFLNTKKDENGSLIFNHSES